MPPQSGGNESVAGWYGAACLPGGRGQFSPNSADFEIDGEQPVSVIAFQCLEPGLQRTLLLSFFEQCDPFGDFPNRYDAEKQMVAVEGIDSTPELVAHRSLAGSRTASAATGTDRSWLECNRGWIRLAGTTGLEPATSDVTGARSDLSFQRVA